ncbi:ABC transporter ATP-binding protein [Flavobacterium tegetincola]|uniref:ABC transporter ATP-binding protein n=1 Tax=Flavobacterium tegetincola TaxID=150172 RepID=UPI0003F7DBB6|nr:ABC transporter ATP-binding protein [Flavobacterium tegetincola]
MSSTTIILKAENISKQYRLGTVGTGTLSHDLNRWWHAVRGKEDPYLKVGDTNDRSSKGTSDYVWALKDINFEVKSGEVLGIIGKNGAGKSTLLKILSKVTTPTSGTIKYKGRIASLLEVGTGFNPELTGRENVYLNGAILGMTKKEITSKLTEIIEFSGCERYIDTPTKRYSSGMTVRLAFAVAAFLEPEILVVDEVLAVGDAEFQKKAIGKMQDISREGGRTVLFVSHNMAAVKSLCTRGIVLENGKVAMNSYIDNCIDYYLNMSTDVYNQTEYYNDTNFIKSIKLLSDNNSTTLQSGSSLIFEFEIDNSKQENLNLHIGVYSRDEEKIIHLSSEYSQNKSLFNKKLHRCIIEKNPLVEGEYYVNILLFSNDKKLEHLSKCLKFTVLNGDFYKTGSLLEKIPSKFLVDYEWN